MPLYQYACSCGHVFEKLSRKVSDKPAKCPKCGKKAKQILGPPAAMRENWGRWNK